MGDVEEGGEQVEEQPEQAPPANPPEVVPVPVSPEHQGG